MKRFALAVAVLLLPVGGAAGGQPRPDPTWGITGPGMNANLARHHRVMMFGIPAPYRSLVDPLPRTRVKISRGAQTLDSSPAPVDE